MGKITWKGEPGVKEVQYEGHTFVAGEPVTTDDEKLLAACSHSGAFTVEDYTPKPKTESPATVKPPSQQSAQGPSPKPGEPVRDPDGNLPTGGTPKSKV